MDADRRLTFEGFSLDLANEQLVCEGEVVALTPKAFAVLRRLVEDNGARRIRGAGRSRARRDDRARGVPRALRRGRGLPPGPGSLGTPAPRARERSGDPSARKICADVGRTVALARAPRRSRGVTAGSGRSHEGADVARDV